MPAVAAELLINSTASNKTAYIIMNDKYNK